jgi:DNA-binding response OmpR family regulator
MTHLLVVDDEKEMAELVLESLERKGFTGEVATSLAEAVEVLKRTSVIEYMLLDVNLGDGDGITFAQRLFQGEFGDTHKNVPFLILSGHASHEGENRLSGVTTWKGFLQKPFSMKDVVAKIRSDLDLRSS